VSVSNWCFNNQYRTALHHSTSHKRLPGSWTLNKSVWPVGWKWDRCCCKSNTYSFI